MFCVRGYRCWCAGCDITELDTNTDYDRHGEGSCSTPCAGESSSTCGGDFAISLYQSTTCRKWVTQDKRPCDVAKTGHRDFSIFQLTCYLVLTTGCTGVCQYDIAIVCILTVSVAAKIFIPVFDGDFDVSLDVASATAAQIP